MTEEPNFKYRWMLCAIAISKRPEGFVSGHMRPKVRKKLELFCGMVWTYYKTKHNRRVKFFRFGDGIRVTDVDDYFCERPFRHFSLDEPL